MSYATQQASAAALIADKGQAVTLTPHTAGSYDTSTSSVTVTETPTVSTTGVVLPIGRFANREGTNIMAGDQQLLLPGDITQPKIGATATIDGTDYTIVEVSPLNPGGTNLIYDCVIRGGP